MVCLRWCVSVQSVYHMALAKLCVGHDNTADVCSTGEVKDIFDGKTQACYHPLGMLKLPACPPSCRPRPRRTLRRYHDAVRMTGFLYANQFIYIVIIPSRNHAMGRAQHLVEGPLAAKYLRRRGATRTRRGTSPLSYMEALGRGHNVIGAEMARG